METIETTNAVVKTTTPDLKKFDKLKAQAKEHFTVLKALKVESDEDLIDSKSKIKAAKAFKTSCEVTRKAANEPFDAVIKAQNQFFKDLLKDLEPEIKTAEEKNLEYAKKLEAIRLEEARKVALQSKLTEFNLKTNQAITACSTVEEIERVISTLNAYSISEINFQEKADEAKEIKKNLLETARLKKIELGLKEKQEEKKFTISMIIEVTTE